MKFIVYILLFILLSCPPGRIIRPPVVPFEAFDILYIDSLRYTDLPKITSRINDAQMTLLGSKVLERDLFYLGEESFIFSLIKILNKLDIDALVVDSDFLPFFQKVGEIIDSSRFFLLASNLFKGGTRKPIFHPFLIKDIAGKKVFFLNLLSDANLRLDKDSYYLEEPLNFLKKRLSLFQKRASFVVCVVDTIDDFRHPLPCLFISRQQDLVKYRVTLRGDTVEWQKEDFSLPLAEEEPSIRDMILKLERKVDSFLGTRLTKIPKRIPADKLERHLANFLLQKAGADFIVAGRPLVKKGLERGERNLRDIWEMLSERGLLISGEIGIDEFNEMRRENPYIFPPPQRVRKDTYRVICPEGFLSRIEPYFKNSYSYLPGSAFETAVEYLRRRDCGF